MAQVSISINNKLYHVACDDGQEAHIVRLSNYMNQRAKELVASVGSVEESLLLVMVGLLMADELSETYGEIDLLRQEDGAQALKTEEEKMAAWVKRLTQTLKALPAKSTGLD